MATAKPTEPEVDEDEAATAAEDKGQSGQASRDMNAMDKPEEAAKEEKFDADKLRQVPWGSGHFFPSVSVVRRRAQRRKT